MAEQQSTPLKIDIVSDVVCPWCIVGYRQLKAALEETGTEAEITWHPFELNPQMVDEGENLREHLMGKYGISKEDSVKARENLKAVGDGLGFTFNFSDDKRMHNTFKAHQLLHWAKAADKQMDLKLALFKAYFTDDRDMNDIDTLVAIAAETGLDAEEAKRVLTEETQAVAVRENQNFWTSRGIQGVPAMVFEGKYLVSGAQGTENYVNVLKQLAEEKAA